MKTLLIALAFFSPLFGATETNIQGDTYHYYEGEFQPSEIDKSNAEADIRIRKEVKLLIKNKYPKYKYDITFTVIQGVVVLRGSIGSKELKQDLEREINVIEGVRNVNNLLIIKQ